jgi:hypothetical protein
MKASIYLVFLTLMISCNKNDSSCNSIDYNKSFIAEVGQVYCVDDKNTIKIDSIQNQLCPCNADCIWEGEFILHMSVTADAVSHSYSFGSSKTTIDIQPFDSYRVKFLSVTPNACDSEVQKDFRVGLVLEKK